MCRLIAILVGLDAANNTMCRLIAILVGLDAANIDNFLNIQLKN